MPESQLGIGHAHETDEQVRDGSRHRAHRGATCSVGRWRTHKAASLQSQRWCHAASQLVTEWARAATHSGCLSGSRQSGRERASSKSLAMVARMIGDASSRHMARAQSTGPYPGRAFTSPRPQRTKSQVRPLGREAHKYAVTSRSRKTYRALSRASRATPSRPHGHATRVRARSAPMRPRLGPGSATGGGGGGGGLKFVKSSRVATEVGAPLESAEAAAKGVAPCLGRPAPQRSG